MNIKKIKGVICAVIAAASYGMNPLFGIPLYNEGMEPLSVLFYRFFLATILMPGILFLRKDGFKLPKKYWLLTLTGGVMIAGTCLFWFLTFRIMDSGIAAAMLFIYPVMVAALMWGFFREKLTPSTAIGMLFAVAGVAWLCSTGSNGGNISFPGVIFIMLSALLYAIYIVMVKTTRLKDAPPDTLTFYAMLFASLLFLIPLNMGFDLQMIPSYKALANALGLALFPSLCAFLFTAVAVNAIGATQTAIMGAMEPVTAVFIGVAVFHEKISLSTVCAIIMIIAAVMVVIRGNSRLPEPKTESQ